MGDFSVNGLMMTTLSAFAQPEVTQAAVVEKCNFVSNIEGTSGYGKKFEWQSYAKMDALNKAAKIGASNIVWERFNPIGAFNGVAIAKVYNCDKVF